MAAKYTQAAGAGHTRYDAPNVFANKPVIGISGGIGSGKSTVARLFGEMGCLVLNADDHVRELYATDPDVRRALRDWWGDQVFDTRGEVDRRTIARIVFADPAKLKRLETLLHPRVDRVRKAAMAAAANDAQVLAYVLDIPLLFEAGLDRQCDALVFVDAPRSQRLERVRIPRNWDETELERREKLQQPLDNKRRMSKYIIRNTADVGFAATQVEEVLREILANVSRP
jgi:dephospho-CoA kinase